MDGGSLVLPAPELLERGKALFARANAAAAAGEREAAIARYREALALLPNWAEAWMNFGVVLAEAGQTAAAIAAQRMALALMPEHPQALGNLGNALQQAGRLNEAVATFRRALRVAPHDAALHFNLGNALAAQGELAEAAEAYRQAIRLAPRLTAAHLALGNVLQRQGRHGDAVQAYETAIRISPAVSAAHLQSGNARRALGDIKGAVAAYRRALNMNGDFAPAWCNLSAVCYQQGLLETAIICARQAIALAPGYADAFCNLGNALLALGAFRDAEAAYRAAIASAPNLAAAHANLGAALRDMGRLAEAEHALRTALELAPQSAPAHFNLGLVLLSAGKWEEGWPEHEWRWHTGAMPALRLSVPQWEGEDARGRTILLHAEQGLGDTLQFVRYAPLLAARGARVILQVQRPLVRLLKHLPGPSRVLAEGETPPEFELHCPLMSLPYAFGTTPATVPAGPYENGAYLRADALLIARWQARLPPRRGALRVGLVWAGDPRAGEPRAHYADKRRSIPLTAFAPLGGVKGVEFFSLQWGKARKDAVPPGLALIDLMGEVSDFADTAALIAGLDLVISVDTAVAHLAGALGKPVWLLSRFDGCWRWLTKREDSPWYPTMRLFRQQAPGNWAPVIARVRAALSALVPA